MDELKFSTVITKTGDKGTTSLYTGERLSKYSLVFEVLGDLDELNSYLGVCKATIDSFEEKDFLHEKQKHIISFSALVASTPSKSRLNIKTQPALDSLEKECAELLEKHKMPVRFIEPGSTLLSAHFDYARTICRRSERKLVLLCKKRKDLKDVAVYFNRLSDYLYIKARQYEKF